MVTLYNYSVSSKNTILKVIKNSPDLDWNTFMHYQESRPSAQSDCQIITQDELDDMELRKPNFAGHMFGIAQIQDIVSNLKQKFPVPTDEQYMEAFYYYLDNDAFIVGGKY